MSDEQENRLARVDGVKTFSATKAEDRSNLGDRVTEWLHATGCRMLEYRVTQSSDSQFHCLTIVVLYSNN